MGTIVRSYEEVACVIYAVLWPNTNTNMILAEKC